MSVPARSRQRARMPFSYSIPLLVVSNVPPAKVTLFCARNRSAAASANRRLPPRTFGSCLRGLHHSSQRAGMARIIVLVGERFVGWVEPLRYPSSIHAAPARWVSHGLNPSAVGSDQIFRPIDDIRRVPKIADGRDLVGGP